MYYDFDLINDETMGWYANRSLFGGDEKSPTLFRLGLVGTTIKRYTRLGEKAPDTLRGLLGEVVGVVNADTGLMVNKPPVSNGVGFIHINPQMRVVVSAIPIKHVSFFRGYEGYDRPISARDILTLAEI